MNTFGLSAFYVAVDGAECISAQDPSPLHEGAATASYDSGRGDWAFHNLYRGNNYLAFEGNPGFLVVAAW